MNQGFVTIEVFVPEAEAEKVRLAMGEAGAGMFALGIARL